ncbi:acyl-CoA desaturase, partial [Streptomyces sp. SID10244]|nr:acyl-CoA desaturase [Streptomyces sp. SID10244]
DDAPETASERRFKQGLPEGARLMASVDPETGRRRGLRSAIRTLRRRGRRADVSAARTEVPVRQRPAA